jgi:hypothetical protein
MVGTAAARCAVALRAIGRHRLSETDWVSTVALGRAQFGAISFCTYSNFAPISKYKVKTISTSKIIETWHVLELILLNNFFHWVPFQFSTEFKLSNLEQPPL